MFYVQIVSCSSSLNQVPCFLLHSILQREQQTFTDLRQAIDKEQNGQQTVISGLKNTIADLQANLDLERSKVLELTSRLERDRNRGNLLTGQKLSIEQKLKQETDITALLKNTIENLTVSLNFYNIISTYRYCMQIMKEYFRSCDLQVEGLSFLCTDLFKDPDILLMFRNIWFSDWFDGLSYFKIMSIFMLHIILFY